MKDKWVFSSSGAQVLTNMSSGDIKAKEGDLVNLLCSAQGEPPITFSWEKDQKPLASLTEIEKPHRSSLLVVTLKDQTSFGKYICHIRDRFQTTTHTILVKKETSKNSDHLTLKEEECENNFVGIIVLAILVAILLAIVAYLICKIHRFKSLKGNLANKSKEGNDLKHVYEIPVTNDQNYEQVGNEQSTYTALKKRGERDDDDHVYSHLNEVDKGYANQEETGI